MRIEIHELHKRLGATMIYVTHDQVEAMTLGHRIVVMKDGEIQQVDTPMNLYTKPINRFVASFLGTPPMNFLDGTLSIGGNGLQFKMEGRETPLPLSHQFGNVLGRASERSVTLGIRPEGLGSLKARAQANPLTIKGRIQVIEMLGAESLVHLDVEGIKLIARFDEPCPVVEGDWIEVPLLEEKISFFDKNSGTNLLN
jgi:multiple sugar transport system ATP-binding protein